MPISRKKFESGDFKVKTNHILPRQHQVFRVLKSNREYAFTAKEIAKRTRLSVSHINSVLKGLKKKGWVNHKSPYFMLSPKVR
jgi:DNA-binding MarR family transcriptional regulator